MPNSFFNKSPRSGPTPFKYSIGEANMEAILLIEQLIGYAANIVVWGF